MSVSCQILDPVSGEIRAELEGGCWGFVKTFFKKVSETGHSSFDGFVIRVPVMKKKRVLLENFLTEQFNKWKSFKDLNVQLSSTGCSFDINVTRSTNLYDVYNALRILKIFQNRSIIKSKITKCTKIKWKGMGLWILDLYRWSEPSFPSVSSADSVVFPYPCVTKEGFVQLLKHHKDKTFNSSSLPSNCLDNYDYGLFSLNLSMAVLPNLPKELLTGGKRKIGVLYHQEEKRLEPYATYLSKSILLIPPTPYRKSYERVQSWLTPRQACIKIKKDYLEACK